jgi:hypothetical protein
MICYQLGESLAKDRKYSAMIKNVFKMSLLECNKYWTNLRKYKLDTGLFIFFT